jgi:translocation and assembly module TamA
MAPASARPPRSRHGRALGLALSLLGLALCPRPAAADVAYDTFIETRGLEDETLIKALRSASRLVALEGSPTPSGAALRRRAEDDLPRLKRVMQAAGYWQPTLGYVLDASGATAHLRVVIEPGPLFHLAHVAFRAPPGTPSSLVDELDPAALGLVIGGPARSPPVAAAEAKIVDHYAQNGRPFAKVVDRKAVVDVAKDEMSVTYTVEPGPVASFGSLTITGLVRTERGFVAGRVAWKEGAPYDSRLIEQTRRALVKTALFSTIRINHADAPDAAGRVAMTLDLVEGPPRSVGAGIAYNTNLGAGGQAFWEHRNLFGAGERLRVTAGVAQRQQGFSLDFRKPDFLEREQDLVGSAGLLKQRTDAFHDRRAQIFAGIERPLFSWLTIVTGLDYERAKVEQEGVGTGNEDYALLGLPVVLRHDGSDDLLNPTTGGRQTLSLTPYHGVSGPTLNFLATRLELRQYQPLDDDRKLVLAGYGAIGSIVGESLGDVPADKRLYAGGAGSVRGYAFQRAGPLDADGVPTGGISSLELGGELRYRLTDTLGLVPFIDGGNVYPTAFPNSTRLYWGAGLGVRYYTIVGPVRLDLATPFTHRPGDNPIQVYISIGQAF